MTQVYDERTQPTDALVARMWFLLLRHFDRFAIRVDGAEVMVSVRGAEHRMPRSAEGLAQIRELARDPRSCRPRTPDAALPRVRAAALAAITEQWQWTDEIAAAMGSSRSAAGYHLVALHKTGHIERQVLGRRFRWRRAQDV